MSSEQRISYGDTVEIDGEPWVWEGVRRGTEARLRREGTDDDWLSLSMPELFARAGTTRRSSDAPFRPQGSDWPADVLDLEKHLLDVFRGTSPPSRAQASPSVYDPLLTTQEQRLATKVEELRGTSLSRSRKTLFNYWKAYRLGGVAELNARLHPEPKKRLQISRADTRLIAAIDRELDRRVKPPVLEPLWHGSI